MKGEIKKSIKKIKEKKLDSVGKLIKRVNQVILINLLDHKTGHGLHSNRLYFLQKYFLFNYRTTKIDDSKVEYHYNTNIFF